MIDEKGRVFGVINIIDLSIIFILGIFVVSIFFGYVRINKPHKRIERYFLVNYKNSNISVIEENDDRIKFQNSHPEHFKKLGYELIRIDD